MSDCFISYRRAPSTALAQFLYTELTKNYRFNVYMDVRRVDGNKDSFPTRLEKAIEAAPVFICILGETDGQHTLQSAWVLREIQLAHEQRKFCIPVFQESYRPLSDIAPEFRRAVKYLLEFDGVHILDRKALFFDESAKQLADLIRPHRKRRLGRRAWLISILALLVMGGLSWLMNNPPLIGGGTTTALEMTNASSPVRFATTQAPTQQPTSTPTATPTSTPDTTTLRTAVRLARRTVTNNADWRPFSWQFAGADMVIVPAGSFRMLDGGGYQQFLEPFWIDRYEVTNAAYRQCVAAGECSAPETSLSTYDDPDFLDFPITGVNWEAARQYAEWRECRLPTEREWEFAARGPSAYNYPWGNGRDATRGNFCDLNCTIVEQKDYGLDDGFAEVAPVTAFPSGASWVGAFNLGGNVAEFTSSAYLPYPYVAADGRENAQTISEFVIRGGAWNHSFDLILERFKVSRGEAQDNVGFRCVRDLHPSDSQ